mmetsp:Transcript_28204/g.78883  ORF Transcript_28204/g.78883 Transcript_28204/m.78883 type:complete len:113 (+) Transcript_28204:96-434(+)
MNLLFAYGVQQVVVADAGDASAVKELDVMLKSFVTLPSGSVEFIELFCGRTLFGLVCGESGRLSFWILHARRGGRPRGKEEILLHTRRGGRPRGKEEVLPSIKSWYSSCGVK